MKKTLPLLLVLLFLISCNSKKEKSIDKVNKKDTLNVDTSYNKINRILNNPFRDINNFSITLGDNFLDSLVNSYKNQKQIKSIVKKDICMGDNCESYKKFMDTLSKKTLYLFKGDGSEYGFSNDQFLFSNDSLKYVRNFSVYIETWSTDTTATVWKIEELVYSFDNKNPFFRIRTLLANELDNFDFTLQNIKPEYKNVDFEKAYQDKLVELKTLLEMKNSEDGE